MTRTKVLLALAMLMLLCTGWRFPFRSRLVSIPLTTGINWVSLSVAPTNSRVEAVFANIWSEFDAAWTYENGEWKSYHKDSPPFTHSLQNIPVTKRGFIVRVTEDCVLRVRGITMPPTPLKLYEGANFISVPFRQQVGIALTGVPILDGKIYTQVPGLHESILLTSNDFFDPSRAYWIYVTEDCWW